MRRISIVRSRSGYGTEPIAFSQRRAAERYIKQFVKRKYDEATDFDRIGRSYHQRIQRMLDRGYSENLYEVVQARRDLASAMEQARALVDQGFAEFRRSYEYNYGDQPYIEDVALYRTLAEMRSA